MSKRINHAAIVRRDALLREVDRMKPLLPDTDATRRCLASIERNCPIEKMDETTLSDFVNLLHRSIQ